MKTNQNDKNNFRQQAMTQLQEKRAEIENNAKKIEVALRKKHSKNSQ